MLRDRAEFHRGIHALPAREWNALGAGGSPFTRHEFLAALERTNCIGRGTGWEPRFLTLRDSQGCVIDAHSLRPLPRRRSLWPAAAGIPPCPDRENLRF